MTTLALLQRKPAQAANSTPQPSPQKNERLRPTESLRDFLVNDVKKELIRRATGATPGHQRPPQDSLVHLLTDDIAKKSIASAAAQALTDDKKAEIWRKPTVSMNFLLRHPDTQRYTRIIQPTLSERVDRSLCALAPSYGPSVLHAVRQRAVHHPAMLLEDGSMPASLVGDSALEQEDCVHHFLDHFLMTLLYPDDAVEVAVERMENAQTERDFVAIEELMKHAEATDQSDPILDRIEYFSMMGKLNNLRWKIAAKRAELDLPRTKPQAGTQP